MTFVRQGARWLTTTILVLGMVVVPWRLFANFGDSLWAVLVGVAYVLVALAGIWQMWRVCVTLTPEKVSVRNPWYDHHITWEPDRRHRA